MWIALNMNQFQSQFFEQIGFMNTGSVQRSVCARQCDSATDQRECMGQLEHRPERCYR
jgi:hypothetical protein